MGEKIDVWTDIHSGRRAERNHLLIDLLNMDSVAHGNPFSFIGGKRWSYEALSDILPLDPPTRSHLRRVYSILALGLLSAAIGSVLHAIFNIGGTISVVSCFVLLLLIAFTRQRPVQRSTSPLLAFTFSMGVTLGPAIEQFASLPSGGSTIAIAFGGTTLVFACFSLAALFSGPALLCKNPPL